MNIEQLKQRPELQEVRIDDDAIIETYGEPITFWMYDFLDLNTYYDFFRSQSEENGDQLIRTLRKIVLNSAGEPVLSAEDTLPPDVLIQVLLKVNEVLGKSRTKLSMLKTGQSPD